MAEGQSEYTLPKKPGKIRKGLVAVGVAGTIAAGGIATKNIVDHYDQPGGTPYQTHSLQETAGISHWDEQIKNQITNGNQIEISNLKINVEEGILYGRYSPVVINTDDTRVGNIAVEFKPGAEYVIDKAIIIKGDSVDPNDPNGDRWAWVDGKRLGLTHDFFINLSSATSEKITVEQSSFIDFSRIGSNGDVFGKDTTGKETLVSQSIQEPQQPQITSK